MNLKVLSIFFVFIGGNAVKILSIIIVTYCSDSFIKECLASIYLHNDLNEKAIEVIIVDNSPHTTDYLKETVKWFPNVKLISNPENAGFGQGNNIGADAASGEILLFLNPDTKFIEAVFSEIVDRFRNNKKIGTTGCRLVDGEGNAIDSYGYFPEKWNPFLSILDKYIFKPLGYVPKNNIYPWGANLFVRRADFYAAGRFDEKFFLSHEEPDLCKRMLPKKTIIINKKIIHYEGHTISDKDKRFDVWMDSLVLYHKKYGCDLSKTLRRYQIFSSLALVRRLLLRKDCCDLKNQIKKIISLRSSLAR